MAWLERFIFYFGYVALVALARYWDGDEEGYEEGGKLGRQEEHFYRYSKR